MFSGLIDLFTLTISYPLRLMATGLTVVTLKLFGVAVTADRTQINLPDGYTSLAITDACSGIDQLLGLIVVAAVMAWVMQRWLGGRVLHFAMFLPAVVLANTVRLVVTVLLYRQFGEVVLENACHRGLGWFQTVLAVTLIWLGGKLIRFASE